MMHKTPDEMAKQMVKQCGDRDLARRTAEVLTSANFAMNPTDSKYWQQVAEVLSSDRVMQ